MTVAQVTIIYTGKVIKFEVPHVRYPIMEGLCALLYFIVCSNSFMCENPVFPALFCKVIEGRD